MPQSILKVAFKVPQQNEQCIKTIDEIIKYYYINIKNIK